MKKNKFIKKGQGYIHESMDRIHVIQNNIQDFLIDAPASEHLRKVRYRLWKAQKQLSEAYQVLGQYMILSNVKKQKNK